MVAILVIAYNKGWFLDLELGLIVIGHCLYQPKLEMLIKLIS